MIKPEVSNTDDKGISNIYNDQGKKYYKKNKKYKIIAAGETALVGEKEIKTIAESYDDNFNNHNKSNKFVIILIILLFSIFFLFFGLYILFSDLCISSIYVNKENSFIYLTVKTNNFIVRNISKCSFSEDENIGTFIMSYDDKCVYSGNANVEYFYLMDNYGNVLGPYDISDYVNEVFSFTTKTDTIYLSIDEYEKIYYEIEYFGDVEVVFEDYDNNVIEIIDDKIHALNVGTSNLTLRALDKEINLNIIVTDLFVKAPEHFNYDKEYLPCNRYNSDEALLLDNILLNKINEAGGYGTRGGVVAAARFLSLEFPYRIDYFFENGRVSDAGVNHADGEGRYYHKGLYLNSDKFSDIKYIFAGPSIWGCPLTNYEDFGKYVSGIKMPNGLDCSGFVSWALYNGGFDVGDRGAGDTPAESEMTDLGVMTTVTKELIDSNTVKAGDLINWWGHIGIIIGIDDTTYYVAESLDTYEGLVVKEYSKEEMPSSWTYIMLMDSVYKLDGNYTAMWY